MGRGMGIGLGLQNEQVRVADPLVPTVFHEPWWLEAATGGRYEQVDVSHGQHVVGRLPYSVQHLLGRRISVLPTLTHVLGPAIDEGSGSACKRLSQRHSVTRELIAKLPKLHRFRQKLHRGYEEVLSFQAAGFRTGVQFTFEVPPRSELESWEKLRNKTRNVIRRAQEGLEVFETRDVPEFLRFYENNLTASGRQMLIERQECTAICTAAIQRNAGKILCVRDDKQRWVAAIFIAWDLKAAYYLMSTRAADSKNGAISLLIWSAIGLCRERGLLFDFDGVANEGSILLYSGFGGEPKPRYIVTKETKRIRLADSARQSLGLLGEENFFDRY